MAGTSQDATPYVDALLAYAALTFLGALLVWAWTRREALSRMNWRTRATNSALALGMLAVVLGLLYWIGLTFG